MLCWLCDRYGQMARNFMLRNIRLKKPYQDDDRMWRIESVFETKREFLC